MSPTFSVGAANGFQLAYFGQSNYHRSVPRSELVQYVEDLFAQNITELDLGEVPGCEGKSELGLDFLAIGAALQHNTYFQSMVMIDVPQKLSLQMAANMLRTNGTVTKVVLRNAGAECPPELGDVLGKNLNLQLQILDISGNSVEPSSMVTLALGIREVTRQLSVLGLANCGLNDRSISSLFSALKTNWGFSLSLQDFDISGNKLDSSGNEALSSWLSAMKGASRLRRLGLSGVNLDGVRALPELKLQLNLEYLDLSHNNLRKIAPDTWNVEMPASSKLSAINLSYTNLSLEVINIVLQNLFTNGNLMRIAVGIAGLDLNHKGGKMITLPLNACKNMEVFDLSSNALGKSGASAIFGAMPPSLTKLNLAGNLRPSDEWVAGDLSNMLKSAESLRSLDLSGRSRFRLKGSLAMLGAALQMNVSLTELDLSNNHMKDAAFAAICQCLRTNESLKTFRFDGNLLTVNGHQAFLRMIFYNRCLTDWTFPMEDLEAAGNLPRHRKVLDQIQRHINGNGEPIHAQHDPFTWYTDWPIPASPAPPFVDIPEYLKANKDDGIAMASTTNTPRQSTYYVTTTMDNTAASSSAPSDAPSDLPPAPPNRSHRASVVPPPIIDFTDEQPPSEAPPRLASPPSPPQHHRTLPPGPSKPSSSANLKKTASAAPLSPVLRPPVPTAGPPPAAVPPPPPPAGGPAPPPPPPTGGPAPPPPAKAPPAPKANKKGTPSSKKTDHAKLGGGDPDEGRGDLLNSIAGFKGGLKKTVTNDRSGPILKEDKKPAGGMPPMF